MGHAEEHREIALKLLQGRTVALVTGALPWPVEEDWALIEQERALWMLLSDVERAEEQTWLARLWSAREGTPERLGVVDGAFGLPRAGYRPAARGSGGGSIAEWLWSLGFQVVAEPEPGVLLVQTAKNRVVPEVDRLMAMLKKGDRLTEGVELLACYDPRAGKAWIEIKGLT